MKLENRTCPICGESFSVPPQYRRKYCSEKCRKIKKRERQREWYRKYGLEYTKKWREKHKKEIERYKLEYYMNNKSRILARQKERRKEINLWYLTRYHQMRQDAITKLGRKCTRCGFSDWRALQIDHKDGGGAEERRNIGSYGIMKRVLEMSDPSIKYQLLCANCNWIKRYENQEQN